MNKELSDMTLEELWLLFPIIINKHNPEYKNWYLIEKNKLKNIIGENNIYKISHIGSTAVEGLDAKPIIDILVEINNNCDINRIENKILKSQWICMYKQHKPIRSTFNKGYTKNGFAKKVFHLHLREIKDSDELYFRDYLIDHQNIANEYATLKYNLKEKYEYNRDGYTYAKTEFIHKYTLIAKDLYKNKY